MTQPLINTPDAQPLDHWRQISEARTRSRSQAAALTDLIGEVLPADEAGFVVFGSLARAEYTEGSDLDWSVVVDGRANPEHYALIHELNRRLTAGAYDPPGPTGMFGGLIFSHDLVHAIGGDEDTNRNMTRRLLLLLESKAGGPRQSSEVHQRVLSAVLARYVDEDANFIHGNHSADRIPRFLLNDVVRLWRTIAVDYANKVRARDGDKWALRNIKLRMSRKLIFVNGLLMCLSWAIENREDDERFIRQRLVEHLLSWVRRTPLESLHAVVAQSAPSLVHDVFEPYDEYLGIINDPERRRVLSKLTPEAAYADGTFLQARDTARSFDAALTRLLFDSNTILSNLVKKYGVF